MKHVYRVFRFLDDAVDAVILIIFIILMLIGLYGVYDSYLVYQNANDTSILKYKPTENKLPSDKKISDNMVAWLTMDDTSIDYPVMQGETNNEYLNKDPYGEYALSGSIFLDSNNSKDFDDDYSLIYGHHMENNKMFGALDDYLDEDFIAKHKTGKLIVEDRTLKLHVFAVLNVKATNSYVFNPTEYPVDEVVSEMEKHASYWDKAVDVKGKQVVALSTCQSPSSDIRTVVVTYVE